MVVRKLSVFLLVIAFHVVVLGVVYLATRSDEPIDEDQHVAPEKELVDDKTDTEDKSGIETPKEEPKKTTVPKDDKPKYSHIYYTVEKGDFLSKIATKFKVSSKEIMDLNNLKDPNKIFLGQKLKIPVSK